MSSTLLLAARKDSGEFSLKGTNKDGRSHSLRESSSLTLWFLCCGCRSHSLVVASVVRVGGSACVRLCAQVLWQRGNVSFFLLFIPFLRTFFETQLTPNSTSHENRFVTKTKNSFFFAFSFLLFLFNSLAATLWLPSWSRW